MLGRLLQLKFKLALSGLMRGPRRNKARGLSMILFFLIFFGAIYSAALAFFVVLGDASLVQGVQTREQAQTLSRAIASFPVGVFFAAFPFLFFSAITIGLQIFYVSSEISLLLSAPLTIRTVFTAKFVEAFLGNSSLFYVFGLPVLAAYGSATAIASPLYYLMLLVNISFYAVIPTALGLMASIFLVRVLPASRARDLIGALGMILGVVFYIGFNLIGQRMSHSADTAVAGVRKLAAYSAHPLWGLPPWSWAGRAVRDYGDGRPEGVLAMILLLGLAAAAVFALLLAVAELCYYTGWSNIQETAARKAPVARSRRSGPGNLLSLLPSGIRAVAAKDLIIFSRDLRQMSLLLMPLAVIVILSGNTRMPGDQPLYFSSRQISLIMLPAILLVLAGISLRVSMAAFMDENRAFWIVMQSPESMQKVLYGKFVYAFLLSALASSLGIALYVILARLPVTDGLIGGGISIIMAAGYCGLGIGVSAVYADFNADPPRFTVRTNGRLLCMLLQAVYAVLSVLIAVGLWFLGRAVGLPYFWCGLIASLSFLGVTAALTILSILWGASRLGRMEW